MSLPYGWIAVVCLGLAMLSASMLLHRPSVIGVVTLFFTSFAAGWCAALWAAAAVARDEVDRPRE